MTLRTCLAAFVAISSLATGGCSNGSDAADPQQQEAKPVLFDEASRRAAQVLSIAQTAALSGNSALPSVKQGDTYKRAVLCNSAIGSLRERFQQSQILNAEQLRVLASVQQSYQDQAAQLASGAKPSRDAIVREYRSALEPGTEAGADALLAMNCLQQWQEQN